MNVPGLLVEYLVVGSTALLWLLPLLGVSLTGEESLSLAKVAALAPAVYVLGMLVDYGAFAALTLFPCRERSLKAQVRRYVWRKIPVAERPTGVETIGGGRSARSGVVLSRDAPALLKEVEMRSSRDRIARSTVLNLIVLSAVCLLKDLGLQHAALASLAALVSLAMWASFEGITFAFETHAFKATQDKQHKQSG
jgi:hypothetical protein